MPGVLLVSNFFGVLPLSVLPIAFAMIVGVIPWLWYQIGEDEA
jgi:hypothetical protein